jgi:hypothetical protein
MNNRRTLAITGSNHVDVLTTIKEDGDPCAEAHLDFVRKYTKP